LYKEREKKTPLPVPRLKNACSALEIGRWSSIGTQYLLTYNMKCDSEETMAIPDNMELIFQVNKLFSLLDKLLHYLQFTFWSWFNPPGIMKDKVTARVGELIFNIMFSSLTKHQIWFKKGCSLLNLSRGPQNICRMFLHLPENLTQLKQLPQGPKV
jgi:hypothetical protein